MDFGHIFLQYMAKYRPHGLKIGSRRYYLKQAPWLKE